jgi:hypothetical protein
MAKSNQPYWQTEPCPPWCWHALDKDKPHEDDDHPEDRRHFSRWQGQVTLTLMPAHVYLRNNDPKDAYVYPVEAQVYLEQRHREVEPRVGVIVEHLNGRLDTELDLTLAEARKLVKRLSKAIALAESA